MTHDGTYKKIEEDRGVWFMKPDLPDSFPPASLRDFFASSPDDRTYDDNDEGRSYTRILSLPDMKGRVLQKHYVRGGYLRSLLGDLYVGDPRPIREMEVREHLEQTSIRVPDLYAARLEYICGSVHRADVFYEYISGAESLQKRLHTYAPGGPSSHVSRRRTLLTSTGLYLAKLHSEGVLHGDLHPENILIPEEDRGITPEQFVLVDIDQARVRSERTEREKRRSLRRFFRALDKLRLSEGILKRTDLIRILRAYGREQPYMRNTYPSVLRSWEWWMKMYRIWWRWTGEIPGGADRRRKR